MKNCSRGMSQWIQRSQYRLSSRQRDYKCYSVRWNTNFRFQRFPVATSRRLRCLSRSRQTRGNSRSPVGQATTCGCGELRANSHKNMQKHRYRKIHWLSQLWPTAPIYCDCERNTLSDVIATSYDRDRDCGRWWKCTPRKYVFDVTSIGQRSSPWTCSSESRDKCSPRVLAPLSKCTTYVATIAFNEPIWKYRG